MGGMEFLLVWLGLSIAVGVLAGRYRRSEGGWFLLALVISPVIAGALLLASGARPPKGAALAKTKTCPRCAETIQEAALVCRFCGYDYQPAPSRVAQWGWGDALIDQYEDGSFVLRGRGAPRRFSTQRELDEYLDRD
jgi:hypothetical protein